MTKAEVIATMVQTLAETFRVPISEPAARGYMLALEDLSPEEIKTAASRALRECRFMPSPAELLELIGIVPMSHEERRRQALREQTQAEIDSEVMRTNARLDAMFGRTHKALPAAFASAARELADAKSVPPRALTRVTDEEKNAAVERIAAQLAARKEKQNAG